jgi:phospholipid/cholesterol/gamma-HCH transport system substrate-binding protein
MVRPASPLGPGLFGGLSAEGAERAVRVVTGMVALVLTAAAVVVAVKYANGSLDATYPLTARFGTAGQGLVQGSDVKIHGVDVGRVARVRLADGRAVVRMDIDAGEEVPTAAQAVIRPKTLFGEKFVDIDPGPAEASGPFLRGGGSITTTVGGYELEQVLGGLAPILRAVRPEELVVVLDTLARAGQGEGPVLNRLLGNLRTLADVQAAHDPDLERFLSDLAPLTGEIDRRAGDVVAGAAALDQALPVIERGGTQLSALLDQTARLSADLADVLQADRPVLEKEVTEGGKVLSLLAARSDRIGPLVVGVRQYLQVQTEVIRVPYGDGTLLAAVKLVVGEDCLGGRVPPCPSATTGGAGAAAARGGATGTGTRAGSGASPAPPPAGGSAALPLTPSLPGVVQGAGAVASLLRGLSP